MRGVAPRTPNPEQSFWVAILPYIEQGNIYRQYMSKTGGYNDGFNIKLYLSPADPTIDNFNTVTGRSSYAANAQVFVREPRMPQIFQDGTTNTITFAERYSKCQKELVFWFPTEPTVFDDGGKIRRATFADNGPKILWYFPCCKSDFDDVYPVSKGNPPVTMGSIPNLTFQTNPSISECDPRIAQTPHSGGMLVGLGDGSVRTLSPGISPRTYWSAVTPSQGESLGSDW